MGKLAASLGTCRRLLDYGVSGYVRQRVTADPMEAGYLEVRLRAPAWQRRGATDTQAIRRAKRAKKASGKLVLARLILNFL